MVGAYDCACGACLSEAEAERRAFVLAAVDACECGACGRAVPAGAANDPAWFVDTMPQADGTILAEIRCPRCW